MDKTRRFSVPAVGGSALLTIFAVLCLTVFALLTLSTALSGARLSDAAIESTENYYAATLEAETILARLRAGEEPEGVTKNEDICSYSCPISENAVLEVELRLADGQWSILRWQSVSTLDWEEDSSLPVWSGE